MPSSHTRNARTLLTALLSALLLAACAGRAPGPAREAAHGAAKATESAAALPRQGDEAAQTRDPHTLRVCADPNNLPFSNERGEGFENKIADLLAAETNRKVEYTWWAQRRGFFRNTLRAGKCDLVVGVPSSFELAQTSRPYYRSTYVFVTRRDRRINVRSFNDPVLRELRVGVQLIGDDNANAPPAHALSKRGIVSNVVGYTVYGDYRRESPPSRIVEAVARGEVDVAVVWGPLAGYYARRQGVPLEVMPVSPQIDLPFLPMVYDISLGVRRGDDLFLAELEAALERRRGEVRKILDDYGVPDAEAAGQTAAR